MDKANQPNKRGFNPRWRGRGRSYVRFPKKQKTSQACDPVQTEITDNSNSTSPYSGWKLYFPEEEYSPESETVRRIAIFENYITSNGQLYSPTAIEESRTFNVDLKLLLVDTEFTNCWKDFEDNLRNRPENTINCLGLAMHQTIVCRLKEELMKENDSECPSINLPIIRARVMNLEPVLLLKQLKSNYLGKLVSVRGTIMRVGPLKLLCTWMAFECTLCQSLLCIRQEASLVMPSKCVSQGCRSKSFNPLLSSPYTLTINWQTVKLQEIVPDDQREGGRVPRNIDCELMADLADSCSPGDVVTVTGIAKLRNEEETKKKAGNVFLLYLEAVSVLNNKTQLGTGRSAVEFNMKDFYAIKEIHGEPQLFRLLVHSLCPSIFGHEVVKAALLLCMFGGCQRQVGSRADPHILVVGDPGMGKSRMLQACSNVAPRGVYVCGNTSTSSGLTVTLKREADGDYALEAGALVLSDQGCCCIDEFDKMSNQHQALLEAMEQQTISIAKAGVLCCLPARTSILTAANPVGGHYNKAKTVSENLKLGPALLSRFDLVFILLDQPNEYLDCMLSEHVMAMHSDGSRTASTSFSTNPKSTCSSSLNGSITDKLQLNAGEEIDAIPHQLLRKYIAYARKYVKPKLSDEAATMLEAFYLDLREKHHSSDTTPVTTRQLKSLIRLTEARAKMELREVATVADAQDTIEIFKTSLIDTLSDDFGIMDTSRSMNGSGMSSHSRAKKFVNALQKVAETSGKSMFSIQEMKDTCQKLSIPLADFSVLLSTLNVQGLLLKKGPKLYQLLSAG